MQDTVRRVSVAEKKQRFYAFSNSMTLFLACMYVHSLLLLFSGFWFEFLSLHLRPGPGNGEGEVEERDYLNDMLQ